MSNNLFVQYVKDDNRISVVCTDGTLASTVTITDMYEDYCAWCAKKGQPAASLPVFSKWTNDRYGDRKVLIEGRIRYVGFDFGRGR